MDLSEIEELQIIISYQDEDVKAAHNAFNIIYKEYSRYLYGVVTNALNEMNIFSEDLKDTVVGNTFIKFYENSFNFKIPESAEDDRCFKGWLSQVAKNELKDLLKTGKVDESEDLNTINHLQTFQDELDLSEIKESVNLKTLKGALASLTERNKGILMMLMTYYEDGKKTPSNVLKMICDTYGTTPDNVRQIKKRSMQKIKKYIEQTSELKSQRHGK